MNRFFRSLELIFRAAAQWAAAQAARTQAARNQAARTSSDDRLVVVCPHCSQKLRIPRRRNKLIVTCTVCRREFSYQYYALGFSSNNIRPLLVGLVGGLAGFVPLELLIISRATAALHPLLGSLIEMALFAACFGAVMGAAGGYFSQNQARLWYGLKTGALLGLVSGVVTGLVAQLVFWGILSTSPAGQTPSLGFAMLARVIGWAVLGLLLGGSYGIQENTRGDLKYGLIGGVLGGAVAGLFFDPITAALPFGNGLIARLIGFSILGGAIGLAVKHFQELGIRSGSREMYRQLTPRLPANPRLLPQPGRKTP